MAAVPHGKRRPMEDEAGKGSAFVVTLPRTVVESGKL
jgi:hypothetical protein